MTRPKKIVRIIDRLNVGGPAIHAVLTTRGLDNDAWRTVLVTGEIEPGEADMSYLLDELDVDRVLIPSLGRELRPLRDLSTAYALWRVIRRERPDVVHTHKAKAGAIGRLVALAAGGPGVGRMVPVKDHATFIAAAQILAQRRQDVNFVFVGGGELEAEVRADLARRGLSARAHLLGWSRQLERIYADIDVVALSSVNEGTP